jgi:hypothetical protein
MSGGDSSVVLVKSSPDAAEFSIDGEFVGSTPSTPRLGVGGQEILVQKRQLPTLEAGHHANGDRIDYNSSGKRAVVRRVCLLQVKNHS